MGSFQTTVGAGQFFALLGFVPDALGEYLNSMRRQLVPNCPYTSHVTVLPPRLLAGSARELSGALGDKLSLIEPFEVQLGEVQAFPASGVIYLDIGTGFEKLRQFHDLLDREEFGSNETYPFHPHLTLAQEFPSENSGELVERARSLWNFWPEKRGFDLNRVSFVQSADLCGWETVREYDLSPSQRRKTV